MRGVNKVILLGNLGKDPEIKFFENGVAKASFSLATSETYTTKSGEKVDNVEWHNIVMWRGLADVAGKYLKKGDSIYIEGKIRNRSWDDADGIKKYITEIEVANMVMLGRRNVSENTAAPPIGNSPMPQAPNNSAPPQPQYVETTAAENIQDIEDDLPF